MRKYIPYNCKVEEPMSYNIMGGQILIGEYAIVSYKEFCYKFLEATFLEEGKCTHYSEVIGKSFLQILSEYSREHHAETEKN